MNRKHKIVAGGAALIAVVVAGGAIAATKALTPKQESQAVLNDAAGQLGVEPSELSNALKQALKNRVDAAVTDGRLTKEQGAEMKKRIDANGVPFFGFGRKFHDHRRGGHDKGLHGMLFGGKLEGAAAYLGMNQMQLLDALSDGKTLAQVARDRNKSADGLIDAMVKAAEKRMDEAVKSGKLTEADKKEVLADLKERITRMVNEGFHVHRGERDRAYFVPSVF